MDFIALAQQCAPSVHPLTMAAVAHVESSHNPYAIGVVRARLARQPRNREEAVATARALEAAGHNFSVGISQINRHNLARYALDYEKAFDPCENLRAGAAILTACFVRAQQKFSDAQTAFSCYYSGNFTTGFRSDSPSQPSYVQKVLNSAAKVAGARIAAPIAAASEANLNNTTAKTQSPAKPARAAVERRDPAAAALSSTYRSAAGNRMAYQ